MKNNWFNSKKYYFTDESVKRQITDSISENLTDSDLGRHVSPVDSYITSIVLSKFLTVQSKILSWNFVKLSKRHLNF